MAFTYIRRASVALAALALFAVAGCTVKDQNAPALTGPSGLALQLAVNAIPDSISQDGGSQSSIKVTAIGPNGKPMSALPLRVDMFVNGVAQDYGTLSARSLVTNTDGVATVVYTAPPSPVNGVFGTCNGLPGNCVSIVAAATSTDFAGSNPEQVKIRLVPVGVILPPAGAPTAVFTMSPSQALLNVPVTFDASASTIGTGATSITSYAWNFGDGATGAGRSVTHTFTSQQNFIGTLTVTNDRGVSATTQVLTSVGTVAAPNLKVVYSPTNPQAGQSVVFNADQSFAAPGHNLVTFNWNFGDGGTATGSLATHAFSTGATYNVVLSVLDDTGQKGSTSVAVTITGGAGSSGGSTTASFVTSPGSPVNNQVVFFNASGSTASTGHTLVKYAWDFGDGTIFSSSTANTNHTFTSVGAYTVKLTVTDDAGTTAQFSGTVNVTAAGSVSPTVEFTSSPASPGVNQDVFFNASKSVAGTGHTISTYAWDFGDGATGSGVSPSHPYTRAGTFKVNLVVTDEAGQTGSNNHDVTVGAASAQIVAAFTFSPTNPSTGQTIFFDSTPSFSPSNIISYVWDFGDGTVCGTGLAACPGTNAKPTHAFAAPVHIWIVRLTITDSSSRTATTTLLVTTQ